MKELHDEREGRILVLDTFKCYNKSTIKEVKGLDIMHITISGKNIDVTEGLRTAVEEKLSKLDKYFNKEMDASVTLSVEKSRQKIEVTIPMKGNIIRSEQVSSDMYVSIDLVEEVIERQLKKYRKKLIDQKHEAGAFAQEFLEVEAEEEGEIKLLGVVIKEGISPYLSHILPLECKEVIELLKLCIELFL